MPIRLPKLRRQAELETLALRLRAEQMAKRAIFLAVALLLAVLALMAAITGLIVWLSHGVGLIAACFIGAGILIVIGALVVMISGPASGQRAAEIAEQMARSGRQSRIREMRHLSQLATTMVAGRGRGKWGLLVALGLGFVIGVLQPGAEDDDGDDGEDEDIDDQ